MKISEYISKEKEKMKKGTPKERIVYFWDYYKWYVIVGVIACFLVGHTVVTFINAKEPVLSGILIDGIQPVEQPEILQTFYDANGIDSAKQEIVLQTGLSLNSSLPNVTQAFYQRIHAGVGSEETDFLMGYGYAIRQCAYDTSHMLADLRDVFSPQMLAQLEGCIYYIDGSVWNTIKQSPSEEIEIPDPHKPQNMADPIPVAIDISSCNEFVSAFYNLDEPVYVAVTVNAPHRELTARFIECLLS